MLVLGQTQRLGWGWQIHSPTKYREPSSGAPSTVTWNSLLSNGNSPVVRSSGSSR